MLHPIVQRQEPSPEQEPAITLRDRDVVVTAGAGAGKTRTLVARYLSLLAEGDPWQSTEPPRARVRSIVAVTFTNKAAREMRSRVRGAIRQQLDGMHPVTRANAAEYVYWRDCYSGLDAARIGTIHSLCADILRAHPAAAGLDPRFAVLEEAQMVRLRTDAVAEALQRAAGTAETAVLFRQLGSAYLRAHLEALLQDRLQARKAFAAVSDDPLPYWRRRLQEAQAIALQHLIQGEAWRDQVEILLQHRPLYSDDRMAEQRRLLLDALEVASASGLSWQQKRKHLLAVAAIDLRGGSQKAWPGGKGDLDAVKGALRDLRTQWRENDLLSLELNHLDDSLAELLPALQQAFTWACAAYERDTEALQALDFDDLEAQALELLESHEAVRARWQNGIRALLVDEYQDTNRRQARLLELLNRGRRLFVVGDAKQSIYRFRGAEVAVFDEAQHQVGAADTLSLATSYRAHPALMKLLNALLAPLMDEAVQGRPYEALQPPAATERESALAPCVEVHLAPGSKKEGALERAARALAYRLQTLAADTRLSYGEMAILCRASSAFAAYEDALDTRGIPYVTVSGRGFFDRPEVRDLLNALQALADPGDDLALAGLLRSPAVGFADDALDTLVQARADPGMTLWELLTRNPDEWSEQEHTLLAPLQEQLEAAIRLLLPLRGQAGRVPVAALLKQFLDRSGYSAALRHAGYERARRNVAKLLDVAHRSGTVPVADFLEYVEAVRSGGVREGEARATAGNAVQIMSVHQAKGLEFPLVAIGDAGRQQNTRYRLLLDPVLGVLPNLKDEGTRPAVYRLASLWEQKAATAESQRMLYVAATRAQEKLLLSGTVGSVTEGTLTGFSGWLEELAQILGLDRQLLPDDDTPDQVISFDIQVQGRPVRCAVYEAGYEAPPPPTAGAAAPAGTRGNLSSPLLKRFIEPVEEAMALGMPAENAPVAATIAGRLVHEALARWHFPGEGAFDTWAQMRARWHGLVDPEETGRAVRRARRLLLRFQDSNLYAWLANLEPGQRRHELPYQVAGANGRPLHRVIDLLYQNEAGRWTVLDFKSDRIPAGAPLAAWAEATGQRTISYAGQVRAYAAAVQQLWALAYRPHGQLCLLDCGGRVAVYDVSDAPP